MTNDVYDSVMENFFDAADELFSLRPICMGFLAVSLAATPVRSSDRCNFIKDEDTLTVFGEPVAHVVETLDATKREMCFRFFPLVSAMTIEPNQLCVAIDEDSEQSVLLKFPSGAMFDISDEYDPENIRWVYDHRWKTCMGLMNATIALGE